MITRRVRAVIIVSILWAILYLPIGILMGAVLGVDHLDPDFAGWPAFLLLWTGCALLSGATFALLVAAVSSRIEGQPGRRHAALLGAIAGAAVPSALGLISSFLRDLSPAGGAWLTIGLMAATSAAAAVATVASTRHSPSPEDPRTPT